MFEYTTVESWDYDFSVAQARLHLKVNAMLDDGWKPIGGIAMVLQPPVRGSTGHYQLAQAMIKRKEEHE